MTLGRSKAAKSRKVEITFHSDSAAFEPSADSYHPAINVKVRNVPEVNASDTARERAWDRTVSEFWNSAGIIAQNHGYSGVFQEGRSNGWAVPFTQHNAKGELITEWTGQGPDKGYPVYPDVREAKERRRFLEFRAAIEALLQDSLNRYHDLALELNEVQP